MMTMALGLRPFKLTLPLQLGCVPEYQLLRNILSTL